MKTDKWRLSESPQQTVTTALQLGERTQLRCSAQRPGGPAQYWLVFQTQRNTGTVVPLAGMDGVVLKVPFADEQLRRISRLAEAALRALVSLANRPSDYGASREALEAARATGQVPAVLALLPVGARVGKAKVQFTAAQLAEVARELGAVELWRRVVLALSAVPVETKVLSVRLPAEVYAALEREALAHLQSPGQYTAALLQQRFPLR